MAIVSKFLIVWTLLELYNAAFTVSKTSPDECLPAHPAPGGIGARSPRPPPLRAPSPAAGVRVGAAVYLLVRLRGERIQRCKETAEDC